jgi:uncharacterized membrane protein HdeD (DUF308 family)
METREIQARPRHQGSQPGDKVQRLQHHVGRPIPERLFVLVHNPAPASLLLLMSPVALGGAVVKLVALVLVVTGVVQLTHSLRSGTRAHKLISAALGATVDGVGVLVWVNPELGSGFFAALLMIFFVVNGLWKPTQAKRFRRYRGWVQLLISGLVSLLFVYLLWSQWPLSGAWAIGILVGLDLLLTGISLIVLSQALRKARSSGYLDTIQL